MYYIFLDFLRHLNKNVFSNFISAETLITEECHTWVLTFKKIKVGTIVSMKIDLTKIDLKSGS